MSDRTEENKGLAEKAAQDEEYLKELVEDLEGSSRRARQHAASVLSALARIQPECLDPYIGDLIDALNRPEAQTRWECLEALSYMVDIDSRACDRALNGAEAALFDEDNGLLRLAAMRFLCRLGATTEKRSEKVWPLIDEGIQCYHGDSEFQEMLIAIIDFASGKLGDEVQGELVDRMKFDAENGRGALKSRASQIIETVGR